MRVLFVAGEVAPFSTSTEAAQLARDLPEHLQEHAGVETRIIMPRYGTVSERRNRLHEVIRLSGSDISVGETTETLKVKVASIPGIRLQVYFMDNVHYFKRKGLFRDRRTEELFEDNAERALYFGRAALTTVENLGWAPDVVHAVGWIAGYVPMLLKNEFADRDLFGDTKTVYTPDDAEVDVRLTADHAVGYGVPDDAGDQEAREVGAAFADAVASGEDDSLNLNGEPPEIAERAAAFYSALLA